MRRKSLVKINCLKSLSMFVSVMPKIGRKLGSKESLLQPMLGGSLSSMSTQCLCLGGTTRWICLRRLRCTFVCTKRTSLLVITKCSSLTLIVLFFCYKRPRSRF